MHTLGGTLIDIMYVCMISVGTLAELANDGGSGWGIVLLRLRCSLLRLRMAAAAAGINKQGAVATMESALRHGRAANASTVKVVVMSRKATAEMRWLGMNYLFCFGETRMQVQAHLLEAKLR